MYKEVSGPRCQETLRNFMKKHLATLIELEKTLK